MARGIHSVSPASSRRAKEIQKDYIEVPDDQRKHFRIDETVAAK